MWWKFFVGIVFFFTCILFGIEAAAQAESKVHEESKEMIEQDQRPKIAGPQLLLFRAMERSPADTNLLFLCHNTASLPYRANNLLMILNSYLKPSSRVDFSFMDPSFLGLSTTHYVHDYYSFVKIYPERRGFLQPFENRVNWDDYVSKNNLYTWNHGDIIPPAKDTEAVAKTANSLCRGQSLPCFDGIAGVACPMPEEENILNLVSNILKPGGLFVNISFDACTLKNVKLQSEFEVKKLSDVVDDIKSFDGHFEVKKQSDVIDDIKSFDGLCIYKRK